MLCAVLFVLALSGLSHASQIDRATIDSNLNSVLELMLGKEATSEQASINDAIYTHQDNSVHEQQHHEHHHHSHSNHYELSEENRASFVEEDPHSAPVRVHTHHSAHRHTPVHHAPHHHHQDSSHKSHHQSKPASHHKNSHHKNNHHKSSGPSQVADVIEQLEVAGDEASVAAVRTKPTLVEVKRKSVDPHLRDKLKKSEQAAAQRKFKVKRDKPAHDEAEDDDVPLNEFGLKKDCHWIQMDFTQNSDSCNQCMTIADAYFRGEDVCACYKNTPGSPMRTRCTEMADKFKAEEDHIRQLAIDNQWNEYYKSYGLCQNYGHCGF